MVRVFLINSLEIKTIYKIKVLIFSGSYPDTTFLTLLIEKLSSLNSLEVYVVGTKNNKAQIIKGVNFNFIASNLIIRFLQLLFYFILNFFYHQKKLFKYLKYSKFKYNIKKTTRDLIILYHEVDIIHIQWLGHYESFIPLIKAMQIKSIISLRGAQLSIKPFVDDKAKKKVIKALESADIIHSISSDLSNQAIILSPNVNNKIT